MSRQRIVCQCGGLLPRPVPRVCPHCGAPIISVRTRSMSAFWPVLIVIAMFLSLAAFVWWMAAPGS